MFTFSLQSGSNGNCIYVEAGEVRLLFDAGISAKLAAERLAAHGRDLSAITALIISHEHDDHVRGAGILHRKHGIPLWMTHGTRRVASSLIGPTKGIHTFAAGERLEIGDVRVFTYKTPHDAVEPICFLVEHDGRRLGIMTDLGHPFRVLPSLLEEAHAAYIESNYDPHLLETGPYSLELQERIRGRRGHLSNDESASMAAIGAGAKLGWVAAAHLSEVNNEPALAMAAFRQAVGRDFPVWVASRNAVSEVLEV